MSVSFKIQREYVFLKVICLSVCNEIETQKAMPATAVQEEYNLGNNTDLFNKEKDFRDSERKPDLVTHIYSLKEGN